MNIPLFDIEIIDLLETEVIAARATGQNTRSTLLVTQTTENQLDLEFFLEKVLSAVQLNLQKDTLLLVITPTENFNFIQFCQSFEIKTLILFGVRPERLGIHFQMAPYEIIFHEQRKYVFVDDLQLIYEERQQGGKRMSGELWRALQVLFLK